MFSNPPVDDFAEFLTSAYAVHLAACQARGWQTQFVWTPAGYALRILDASGGQVEVTDTGRPLPAAPTDVSGWLLTSPAGSTSVPAGAPLPVWLAAAAALLEASR